MTKTLLRMVLLFALAAVLSGQRNDAAYFSLSSSGTFGSSGAPSISLSAWNVDSLEFRVYRIKDPEKFFGQLENPHEFGGIAPRPPRTRSVLENIHSWKRGLKAHIRRSLRAQFTEAPSAHFESLFPSEKTQPTTGATQFAEVPLLNPQQLTMSFTRPVSAKSRWERQNVSVPVKERGVYLVEAVSKDLRAYTILMVSDLALITKTVNGRSVNFVVDRASGQPVAGATITAVTKDGAQAHAETDRDGIAELKMAPLDGALTIIASAHDDVAVNSVEGRDSNRDWTGYIYTDRPVYRPGHTVHFKALLRQRTEQGYQVPAGKQVSVEIQDAEQKPVYQKSVTVGANGTIHDDLTLASGASLGSYFIQVKSGDESFMSGNFEVQEYKKPEYEVRVIPSKNRVLEGATVPVVVDAQYFFGEPVSGAKVKYRIFRQPYWFPYWYDSDEDRESDDNADGGNDSDDSNDSAGDQQNEQQGQLDANGKLTINVPTAISEHSADFMYRIEVGVTDAANREISGTGWIVATYGNFLVNATPERYVYAPGDPATFTIQARDYDNKPVQTHAHVELLRQNRRGDPTSVAATDAALDATGSAKVTLQIPKQGGSFLVRVTAPTVEKRQVQSTTYVWVNGGGWDMDTRNQTVEMITDKKTYRAGDTAKLMIVAGKPGTAVYVTVEGRDIGQYKMLRAADSTVTFEVPVTVKDEPGITVNAVFVRDGIFYRGDKYIRVPPVEHTLNVKVSTDKPQYQPGQTADYAIDVTDNTGKPVPRADFSLGVVDEAIYGVRKDTTQDILSFFYSRDYNRVPTESSMNYFFNGEAGKRRMQLAELRPRSRLAQLKPDRLVQPKVRKAFPDTAFWAADLTTDDAGHARAKIDFPDSLTTWRATARGITASTMVGGATLKTIVRKNLIVRLAAPRFFVRGDEVVIPVIVHNYLQSAKTAHVSLDVKGLDVLDGATKDVLIPSRGEATVNWRVRAQQTRSATLTAKALTNEESDALQIDLPVNFAGVKLSQSKGGSMAANGSARGSAGNAASFDITFPDKIEPGSRSLALRVSPSIAGALFGALDYLTSFPYGCVEQTMSSFLPNIVVKDAFHSLNLKADLDEAALQEKIHAGLDRLHSFQHQDGGWGWWETDDSHPFMTAYVVAGLVQARAGGTQVPQDVIDRGVAWLKKEFAADPKLAADLRAYIVYSLAVAGQPDGAALNQVNDKRSDLSPYGLALLGLAFEQMKDSRAGAVADAVIARAQQDSEQAWWPANRDPMLDFDIDATPEATAFVTRFLSHERNGSPLLPKAALWLMNHRNEGEWWDSTKQTATVIYGLTDYLKVTNELTPNLTATIYVNDKPVLTRKITEATALNPPDLVLDESALQPGVNHIRVTSSGDGRLYYSVRAEYYSNEARFEKTGTTSLNLLRDYFRLAPVKDGDRIVYDTVPLGGSVAVGDLIAVRLTVTGSEWKYMMVEDPIPAGTEFVERDNLYELRNKPPWWEYFFTRRELHDDRMAIFQTYFSQGQQQYFYLLKVVNPGAFQVSPARVGPMYQPAVMATTESRRLEVK